MADDNVTIWNSGLKFGRKPANGELLIGDNVGFKLATLAAGSGVTISNTAGGISIAATGSGGTVTSVTATSPLSSTGGATPDISLSGTVPVNRGGTGVATLALNNVILGNGTSAVQTIAPGTSGNLLTSNGTTFVSSAPSTDNLVRARASITNATATPTVGLGAVNVASCTRASGVYTVTFTNALASAEYQVVVSQTALGATTDIILKSMTKAVGSVDLTFGRSSTVGSAATGGFDFVVYGGF